MIAGCVITGTRILRVIHSKIPVPLSQTPTALDKQAILVSFSLPVVE
jgi:hypothetical protein